MQPDPTLPQRDIEVNGSSGTADHTIQTADVRYQMSDGGSSGTADPYSKTLRSAQGDGKINPLNFNTDFSGGKIFLISVFVPD